MGFVQRMFTPPGTGGREAAAIQQAADLKTAQTQMSQMSAGGAAAAPPTPPSMPAPAAPPQIMMPGSAPGAKKAGGAAKSPTSFLGAPLEGANQAKKSLLGQ